MGIRFKSVLLMVGLSCLPAVQDTWAQSLRVMLSATYDAENNGPDKCGPFFPPERLPLAGVRLELSPESGQAAFVYTKDTSAAYVDVPPGIYTLQAAIPGQSAKVGFIYLQGRLGQHVQPKTDKGGVKFDLTADFSHKTEDPQNPGTWDYWINVHMCVGEHNPSSTPPKIRWVTTPSEMVSGVKTEMFVGFFDPEADITTLRTQYWIEKPILNDKPYWATADILDVTARTGGKALGEMKVLHKCEIRDKRERVDVHARLVLDDAAGNESEGWEIFYTCVKARSPKILGKATAFDANGDPVGTLALDSKIPKPSARVGARTRSRCASDDRLKYCRSLPRKAGIGRAFRVTASATNLGAETVSRLEIVETLDKMVRGECTDVPPGVTCRMEYSARLKAR